MSHINLSRIGLLSACLFSLTIFVAAPGAVAETKVPAPKIAVIDYQVILRKSSAIKSVREQAEMHRKKLQSETTDKEKKLRADGQALARQRAVLSPEAFAKRQSELQSKMIEVQGQVQVRKRQLERAFAQADRKFEKTVVALVDLIAKENGYNLVFNKNPLMYAAPKFDITAMVLKRLDKKLPTLKVKVPAK